MHITVVLSTNMGSSTMHKLGLTLLVCYLVTNCAADISNVFNCDWSNSVGSGTFCQYTMKEPERAAPLNLTKAIDMKIPYEGN